MPKVGEPRSIYGRQSPARAPVALYDCTKEPMILFQPDPHNDDWSRCLEQAAGSSDSSDSVVSRSSSVCTSRQKIAGSVDSACFNSYKEGSLVLAQLKGFPPWPSIVLPRNGKIMARMRKGSKTTQCYHVVFLAYDNQRAWVPVNMITEFSSDSVIKSKKSTGLEQAFNTAFKLLDSEPQDRFLRMQTLNHHSPLPRKRRRPLVSRPADTRKDPNATAGCSSQDVLGGRLGELAEVRVSGCSVAVQKLVTTTSWLEATLNKTEENGGAEADADGGHRWLEGLVVWARLKGFSYWPAVVGSPGRGGASAHNSVHVMFLAYGNQHAWVPEEWVEEFRHRDQFKDRVVRKNSSLYVPKRSLKKKFIKAVEEAEELLLSKKS